MFATWNTNGGPMQVSDRPITQRACNNCRTKKLKCNGQKGSCDRCERLSIACVYTSLRGSRRDGQNRRSLSTAHVQDTIGTLQNGENEHQPAPVIGRMHASSIQHSPDPQGQDEEHQPEAAGAMQLPPHDQERRMAPADPHIPSLDSPKLSWDAQSPVLRYPEPGTFQDEQSLMKIDSYFGQGDLNQHHMDTGGISMLFDSPTASHNLPQGLSDRDSTDHWQFFPDSDLVVVGASGTGPTPPSSSSERATTKNIVTNGTTGMEGQQQPSPARSAKRGRESENTRRGPDRLSGSSSKDSEAPCHISCLCQQRIVFLIDELEMQLADGSTIAEVENIDAALATHKEAVRFAELMLACQRCSKQLENMTLLYLLAQRQVRLCEAIVTAYLDGMKRWNEPGCRQVVRFGEYELDSRAEWSLLLGNVIMLQLRTLFSIVDKLSGNEHIQGPRLKIMASIRHLLGKARIDSPNLPG